VMLVAGLPWWLYVALCIPVWIAMAAIWRR
jgi:hypothetical protein